MTLHYKRVTDNKHTAFSILYNVFAYIFSMSLNMLVQMGALIDFYYLKISTDFIFQCNINKHQTESNLNPLSCFTPEFFPKLKNSFLTWQNSFLSQTEGKMGIVWEANIPRGRQEISATINQDYGLGSVSNQLYELGQNM